MARALNSVLAQLKNGDSPMSKIMTLTVNRQRIAILALLSFMAMC
ncbi:MAG: hypothetical protein ACT4PL_09245 [Phycisphaerales bacterium]